MENKNENPETQSSFPDQDENDSQTESFENSTTEDIHDLKIAQLEAELTEVEQQLRDAHLRAQAEIENIRRRAAQDVERASKFSLEKFVNELLPVIDNLERALEVADKRNPELSGMIEGIDLTLKSLLNAVNKFGVDTVHETEVPFNPDIHQAMSMVESDTLAPNHVTHVMQKGYRLHGRLLRPAMVMVSKKSE